MDISPSQQNTLYMKNMRKYRCQIFNLQLNESFQRKSE